MVVLIESIWNHVQEKNYHKLSFYILLILKGGKDIVAGKFINTKYYDTQESLVNMHQDLVQNPFYLFNDKKGTRVTYYNINTEKTTLDPASKLAYTNIGDESPIRYNIIHDMYLYQFNKLIYRMYNKQLANNKIYITLH